MCPTLIGATAHVAPIRVGYKLLYNERNIIFLFPFPRKKTGKQPRKSLENGREKVRKTTVENLGKWPGSYLVNDVYCILVYKQQKLYANYNKVVPLN